MKKLFQRHVYSAADAQNSTMMLMLTQQLMLMLKTAQCMQ